MDKLTQLQEQCNKISELFYVSIGSLQQQAPPIETINDEDVGGENMGNEHKEDNVLNRSNLSKKEDVHDLNEAQKYNDQKRKEVNEMAMKLGKEIIQESVMMEKMIDELPGLNNSEQEQEQQLMELNKLNQDLSETLLSEISNAEYLLGDVSKMMQQLSSECLARIK